MMRILGRISNGRPAQGLSPFPRQQEMIRPVASPPTVPSSTSAFTAVVPTVQRLQEPAPRPFPQAK